MPVHNKSDAAKVSARWKELRPARQEAEVLFRQGKNPREVGELLHRQYGDIAVSTIAGWKNRMPAPELRKDIVERGRKASAEVDRKVDSTAPPAIDLSHLGQPLIGLGLIILGAWLDERKSK